MAAILFAFSCAFSFSYGLIWTSRAVSHRRSVLKSGSIVILAAGFWKSGAPDLLIWALLLCSLGDFYLSRVGEAEFLRGMIAFAVGHLLYVPLFLSLGAALNIMAGRLILVVPLLVVAMVMVAILWPRSGRLRRPVTLYTAVILTMALTGLSLPMGGGLLLTMFGVGLFAVSDTVLALEMFVWGKDHPSHRCAAYVVWWTYWPGQVLIGAGVLIAAA